MKVSIILGLLIFFSSTNSHGQNFFDLISKAEFGFDQPDSLASVHKIKRVEFFRGTDQKDILLVKKKEFDIHSFVKKIVNYSYDPIKDSLEMLFEYDNELGIHMRVKINQSGIVNIFNGEWNDLYYWPIFKDLIDTSRQYPIQIIDKYYKRTGDSLNFIVGTYVNGIKKDSSFMYPPDKYFLKNENKQDSTTEVYLHDTLIRSTRIKGQDGLGNIRLIKDFYVNTLLVKRETKLINETTGSILSYGINRFEYDKKRRLTNQIDYFGTTPANVEIFGRKTIKHDDELGTRLEIEDNNPPGSYATKVYDSTLYYVKSNVVGYKVKRYDDYEYNFTSKTFNLTKTDIYKFNYNHNKEGLISSSYLFVNGCIKKYWEYRYSFW